MKTLKLAENIYQFHNYFAPINLSFNNYLIIGKETLLVQTGDTMHAQMLIPKIKEILGDKPLDYVFISHFESDECGGFKIIEQQYPNIKAICSEVTARQLMGFNITKSTITQSPNSEFSSNNINLKFIGYPAEMHNWVGLLLFDKTSSILFSSDVYVQLGEVTENLICSDIDTQIKVLENDPFLSNQMKNDLKNEFLKLPISIIAPGHGACIKL